MTLVMLVRCLAKLLANVAQMKFDNGQATFSVALARRELVHDNHLLQLAHCNSQ